MRVWRLLCSIPVIPLCLLSGFAVAQSGTSSAISGTVLDPSGATVSGATVEAASVETHAARTAQTDSAGHYLFSQVNPGTYQVKVSANGFAIAVSEPTPVLVGETSH